MDSMPPNKGPIAQGLPTSWPHPSPSQLTSSPAASTADPIEATLPQTVRFASVNQEIEPSHSLQSLTLAPDDAAIHSQHCPQAQDEIRSLSLGLQKSHIQQRRMSNYAYEPVSLPVSRAPSTESIPNRSSGERLISAGPSPKRSPPASNMPTPPLTPYGTRLSEGQPSDGSGASLANVHPDPHQMAPQIPGLPKVTPAVQSDNIPESTATSRPSSHEEVSTRPTSLSQQSSGADNGPRKETKFSLGPSRSSTSPSHSRERSPSHEKKGGSGTATPPIGYARPMTPVGNPDDPYARSKRRPPPRNLDSIDARFVFGGNDSRRRSGIGFGSAPASSTNLPRSSSGKDLKNEFRLSTFSLQSLGGKKDLSGHLDEKSHGSMSELKRFLGIGSNHHKSKKNQSPSRSAKSSANYPGSRTPPHQTPTANIPFADDHGLETKWGKFGKILGSGAGGSVRLMKRSSDGVTFAVKSFRDRHSYESEREYNKKVTAEFCIGSTLHHGNIIETLDIIQEKGRWYVVMEYAPYDLFAIVMTGKMSREEIACCFLQIVGGVAYLHSMGLAHRDLKLDNVVVNDLGIMKIIDFGSATVFKYPFENDVIMASGVVGSDPYLAPEVYEEKKYEPQGVDIWSLAIIFACMSLRRFPWKAPRSTDNSYKLFASTLTPGTALAEAAPKESDDRRGSAPVHIPGPHHHGEGITNITQGSANDHHASGPGAPGPRLDAPKQDVIKGPWRLLRLLPRETRSIMGKMLEIDTKKRATLETMMADPWLTLSPVCHQAEGGKVIHMGDHHHTLEPGTPAAPAKDGRQ